MNVKATPRVSLATWADWQNAYDTAIERHFFLSPLWARSISNTFKMTPHAFLFQFPTQDVVLPCLVTGRLRGLLYRLAGMPLEAYGGLLSNTPIDANLMQGIADSLGRDWTLHTLYMTMLQSASIADWGGHQIGTYAAEVLDLSGGYAEVWKHKFDKKQRESIRRAQRSGLELRKARSPEDLDSFYGLYSISQNRLGSKSQKPKVLLERLLSGPEIMAELWMARKGVQDIAGIVVVNNGNDLVHAWLNGSNKDYWKYCPNNLLYAMAIEEACERGFGRFDFMTSGQIKSLEQFKESFGAVPEQVTKFRFRGRIPLLKYRLNSTWQRGLELMRSD